MWTDEQADMINLKVAFHSFPKALKNCRRPYFPTSYVPNYKQLLFFLPQKKDLTPLS